MSNVAIIVLLACYASLAFELTVLHVPSVASARSLWKLDQRDAGSLFGEGGRALQARSPGKWLRLFLPLVVVYAVFLFPLYVALFGSSPHHYYVYAPAAAPVFLALPLMILGRAITMLATLAMRRHAGASPDPPALLASGLFRRSRNPGLVGMYLFFAGAWLLLPSAWLAAGLVVYVLHMHYKVRIEEDFLANRFGDLYRAYRRATPRYLL